MIAVEEGVSLRVGGDYRVPLAAVRLGGRIVGRWAELRLEHDFEPAPRGTAMEATYVFPLPPGAVVTDFAFSVAGEVTRGKVEEREKAAANYRKAVRKGQKAGLVEEARPEVFTLVLGNLSPEAGTRVELTLLVPLEPREGILRWRIPTLMAPRYGAVGEGAGSAAGVPALRHEASVPYRLTIDLAVPWTRGLEVDSPSHELLVRREGDVVRIGFDGPGVPLDRDLVLDICTPDEPVMSWMHAESTAGQGVLAVMAMPDMARLYPETAARPLDVVFLLDRSGSMGGTAISEARRALRLCLRQLRPGDRVGILAFDDSLESFAKELVPFGQDLLERADRWIEGVDARGGTDLHRALEAAYRLAPDAVHVLLTDAEVWGEDELLRLVDGFRSGGAKARLHAFGIGTNVVMGLLERLARATAGDAVGIVPGESIDDKVAGQFASIMAVRLEEVSLVLEGGKLAETLPVHLPPLIDGVPWHVLVRFKGKGPMVLHLTARGEAGEIRQAFPLSAGDDEDQARPDLMRLWARERVLTALREPLDKAARRQWSAFAVTHQAMTPLTSWIAVDRKGKKVSGHSVRVDVPLAYPAEWEMEDGNPPPVYSALTNSSLDVAEDSGDVLYFETGSVPYFWQEPPAPSAQAAASSRSAADWQPLLLRQQADGQWGDVHATLVALVELAPWVETEAQIRAAFRRAMPGLLDRVEAGLEAVLSRLVLALARTLGLERRRVGALVARLLPPADHEALVRRVLADAADPDAVALASSLPGKKDLGGEHLAAPLLAEMARFLPST
ncbi:MAG: VIT domain-containing protein [Candidatus Sericytochromatia bacterium]|nr:VIT domain-containing protein [Candidatus Sericytochromatia bacterium]